MAIPGGVKRSKPRSSPKPKKVVKAKPRVVKVAPEATRPVTPTQRKEIDRRAGRENYTYRLKKEYDAENEAEKKHGGGALNLGVVKAPSLHEIGKELKGQGYYAAITHKAGEAISKHVPTKVLKNLTKDVVDFPSQAVPSLYVPGKEVVTGHPKKAVKIVVKGITETVKHPTEHPLNTVLIARGGVSTLGRGAGAAMRSGALGKGAKGIASTERAPLKLTGKVEQQQRYSKDVIDKGVQKLGEKSKTVVKVRQKRALNRRVDREIGANEGVRRTVRERTREEVESVKPKHHDAVPLVNEGVLKHPTTVKRDLQAELQRLREAKPTEPVDRRANADNIKRVEKLLNDQKFIADPTSAFGAARAYARAQKPVTVKRVHYGDLEPKQVQRRVILPHAVREMGLKYDEGGTRIFDRAATLKAVARRERKTGQKVKVKIPKEEFTSPRFVSRSGQTVSDRAILEDFKAKGGDPKNLSYVPESASFKGARNFYVNTSRRGSPERAVFKGKNTKGAQYERDFDVLVEQAVKAAGKVSSHEGVDRLISNFGHSKPGGKMFTGKEAERERLNLEAETGEQWTPMRVLRGQSKEAGERIKAGLTPGEMPRLFSEHVGEKDGNVVLFPEKVAKRIRDHESVAKNPMAKDFAAVNQRFRHVVLPTSPRWFTGNITEMVLRTAVEDPTYLKSVVTGRHLESAVKELGGQAAVERLRAAGGAGHFGSQSKLDIHRVPETEIAKAVHALRRAPGPKQVVDAWDLYKRAVFGANSRAESLIYYAGLGKEAAREVQSFTGSWHKTLDLGGPAYRDVAKGLLDSNNVERYARAIDSMRGRYSNLSPKMRAYTTTITPFVPWYMNALWFVGTLPIRHPIKTAVLAGINADQKKALEKAGLTHFGEGAVPGFLQGSIPTKKGLLRASQYSPFGAFSDPAETAAGSILPQASFAENLAGLNYKHQQLRDSEGHPIEQFPERIPIALNTLAESFTPFLRHVRQVREQGGSSRDTSTAISPKVKAGTRVSTGEGLKRTFNPFYISGKKVVKTNGEFSDLYKTLTPVVKEDFSDLYRK